LEKLLELVVVEGEGIVEASELSWSSLIVTGAVGRTERGRTGNSEVMSEAVLSVYGSIRKRDRSYEVRAAGSNE
jgi:hypothetical protein